MKNGKERRLYRISMVITAMMFIGVFEDSCQNCTTVPVNGYRNS